MAEPPSSPPSEGASTEDALSWYKVQYEQLEQELAEFRESSRELEQELEKDIDAAEKRERGLQEKAESLNYEVDEWKVRQIGGIARHPRLSRRDTRTPFANLLRRRGNTESPRTRRAQRRIPSRRRSRLCGKQIGPCSSGCATLRLRTMISSARPAIPPPLWKISSLSTISLSSAASCLRRRSARASRSARACG